MSLDKRVAKLESKAGLIEPPIDEINISFIAMDGSTSDTMSMKRKDGEWQRTNTAYPETNSMK